MLRFASALGVLLLTTPAGAQQAPRNIVFQSRLNQPAPLVVNSHILYLNNCRPNGCTVTKTGLGNSDSRTDKSDITMKTTGMLPPFGTAASWDSVVACVKGVMAPFNITVTDVDPGMADHFEIMIAGSPLDLNLPSGVGGVADYLCAGAPGQCGGSYFPNALVFDFAEVWGSSVNEICATAAQEIAHSWTLDHATGASDPMTYKMPIQTPITYRDNAPCGSDCQYQCGANICNAFGVVCANAGGNNGWDGTHLCMETGTATQNEVAIIKGLFGPAGALPPTVALTTPTNGAAIQSGTAFPITATCTSNDGIQELDMSIDGVAKASLATSPAMFMGPATLADGTHHIAVLCGTKLQATATATADVIVGHACQTDTDCPDNHICYQHACIAGPMNGGGLGTGCTTNTDCASGDCANDGTQSLCVVPCDPAADMCPSGFGCRATDNGAGVCWLGDNAGSTCGGCDTRGNGAGTTLVSLTFGALWITRRKRR